MLKYDGFSVVLQEVPEEITLAFNITGCPYRCVGCHSAFLQGDSGTPLLQNFLEIISVYAKYITCVCFMGGDHDRADLDAAVQMVRVNYPWLSLCLYTGNDDPDEDLFDKFDYIKFGHYDSKFGGLDCPTTNQKMFYHNQDITKKFFKRKVNE